MSINNYSIQTETQSKQKNEVVEKIISKLSVKRMEKTLAPVTAAVVDLLGGGQLHCLNRSISSNHKT